MADIILFSLRREVDSRVNLDAFIALCREKLTTFGERLDFASDVWDLTDTIRLKAKSGALRVSFTSWAAVVDGGQEAMPEPFRSFAKAYFRYQHGLRPTKVVGQRIAALRALGAALDEHGTADLTVVDAGMFNRAAQLVGGHFEKTTAYRVGIQLDLLATFLDDNHLSALPLHWHNPLARPVEASGRVGSEFEEIRHAKLPSAFALDALARAFRAAEEPVDVVVTAVAALLCSAPERINEVLRLKADCEVRQERQGSVPAYGLRFWPSKGAGPMIKWVIPSMVSVVEEALARLRRHTGKGREVASWYEDHPTSMYLPAHLEHLRGRADLSMAELAEMLFVRGGHSGVSWCKSNGVSTQRDGRRSVVAFVDVQKAVLAMLPRGFPFLDPDAGLRYRDALCVVRRNALHASRGEYWGVVDAVVDQGQISRGLGNCTEHGFPSVFDRLGLREADGGPIVIRSHQFRHYLNTLAHAGGMSELDIAKWSGRADIRHNSAYNHVSDRDMQARLAEIKSPDGATPGQLVPRPRVSLIPRAKFAEMDIPAAHTTDLGFCTHDFAMSPCQIHMDCMNCNEQVCIKGDSHGEANARAMQEEIRRLLREARTADADGAFGAEQWVRHQEITLERLTQLIAILDNPQVACGAVIRLAHVRPPSRLRQAAEARALSGDLEVARFL